MMNDETLGAAVIWLLLLTLAFILHGVWLH